MQAIPDKVQQLKGHQHLLTTTNHNPVSPKIPPARTYHFKIKEGTDQRWQSLNGKSVDLRYVEI
jgi:hypothetical protein